MRSTRRKDQTPLVGELRVPGDKSISHRAVLLGAAARGRSRIAGLNLGRDVRATARIVAGLGARVALDESKAELEVEGSGWAGLREPADVLDAGNSGTSLRCALGICAGIPGLSVLTGDASLRRRPMLRVVNPLRQMGASIDGRDYGDRPPLAVRGGELTGGHFELPVASAQVKTALLLAGMRAAGTTTIVGPGPSRDHTERMLEAAGAPIRARGLEVALDGGFEPPPADVGVPGDISSAMFLLAAGAVVPGSHLMIVDVGLNPTRTGALDVLRDMGAEIRSTVRGESAGEPVGTVEVRSGPLTATTISGPRVATLIDEIPILAVVATHAEGETVIRDAAELRVKESDRIAAVSAALGALGADVEELPDGLVIRGPTPLTGGEVEALDDHRIALAFAVAGLVAGDLVRVRGWSTVETSFPEFLDLLARAQGRGGRR